jgi:hypothetical protein
MGLLKEELHYFMELQKRQVQIYPDACDVGVIITDEERLLLRGMVKDLSEGLKTKMETWGDETRADNKTWGSSWECLLPFEYEDGYALGCMVKLNFHRAKVGAKMENIIEVELRNANEKASEWGWRN